MISIMVLCIEAARLVCGSALPGASLIQVW